MKNKFIFKKILVGFTIIFCVGLMVYISIFPKNFLSGIKNGLSFCCETMIPSLIPFLILSSFLTKYGAVEFTGKYLDKFSRFFFRISGTAFGIFLMSLVGGFPVGAKITSALLKEKRLSKNEATRLMTCSINAGPAFVICAVGNSMLGSKKAGLIIFISLTLSAFIIFILSGLFFKSDTKSDYSLQRKDFSDCLVSSVNDSAVSMINICMWIIIFSAIFSEINSHNLPEIFTNIFSMIFEISVGCKSAFLVGGLPLISLAIGWSGICVHCQIFSDIVFIGIKKGVFYISRILHGLLSYLICSAILHFFPCTISVFASLSASPNISVSSYAPVVAGLLFMCAISLADFRKVQE